jgi:hypothetical protein
MVAVSPPALAAQSEPYSVTRCIHLSGVSTYVQMTASGTLSWTVEKIPVGQRFNDVTVHNPDAVVQQVSSLGPRQR